MTDLRGVLAGGLNLWASGVRQLPLANEVVPLLADVERMLLTALRDRLNTLESSDLPQLGSSDDPQGQTVLTTLMRHLLDRSMYNSPLDSREALYLNLLEALVPDEARILAALSDGSAYPLMHIAEPGVGTPTVVLENASTVGRSAGVSLPQHTPLYVTRLLTLGLVEPGPEASRFNDEYEMLLTEDAVSTALARARRGVRSARVIRQTVRITILGQDLWEAAK